MSSKNHGITSSFKIIVSTTIFGHENIPVVVTETGWPSCDSLNDVETRPIYAEMYLCGLLYHLQSGRGTPLRKEGVAEAYIYEFPYYHRSSGEVSSSVSTTGIRYVLDSKMKYQFVPGSCWNSKLPDLGSFELFHDVNFKFLLISIPGRNVYVGVLKLYHNMLPEYPDVPMYLLLLSI
ncbi:hypothetical protein L2E82_42574 [Cichorium intybus]|uniref:Uncharacterized protein n=1 Tax=Cichorium intybus TaxID=13427 RepID=A0ACB8ZM83_CICIN|nr:hypothetical protein L2E82_42574 [Cichorium intybus]